MYVVLRLGAFLVYRQRGPSYFLFLFRIAFFSPQPSRSVGGAHVLSFRLVLQDVASNLRASTARVLLRYRSYISIPQFACATHFSIPRRATRYLCLLNGPGGNFAPVLGPA